MIAISPSCGPGLEIIKLATVVLIGCDVLRDLFFLNFLLLYFQILRDFFHFRFSAEIELYDPLQDGQASRQAAAGSTHSRRRTTKRVATKVSDFQKSTSRL